ncbi:peroxidase-like isoform X2 [Paramacrobiotus metropolitanus]|uniref:peroxidase-like isoform X2 n=1 Tax=Paramacrobiotus metropolitanus TaxID=2943436 RepID=UPI0024458F01|nr:peroxidase-like isoform X2 [Paramacrobiotus metropolitanus]
MPSPQKKSPKSLADTAYYSYEVDKADKGGIKGFNKKSANMEVSDDTSDADPDVLAFDIAMPPPPSPAGADAEWDVRTLRQSKLSAMQMAHQDFRRQMGTRPAQCPAQGQPTGPQHEAPWVWAVGRPTNRTRFAYESELAGRRAADQLGQADPSRMFDAWNNQALNDDEDCFALPEIECSPRNAYRTFDGTCNNLENPLKGTAGAPQRRMAPANYADGVSKPRDLSVVSKAQGRAVPLPSSRRVSISLSKSVNLPNNRVTAMFNQWAQLIAHEIINTPVEKVPDPNNPQNSVTPKCCDTTAACLHPACFPISIPPDDPFYTQHGLHCLEFVRAQPAPREGCKIGPRRPINLNTAYIDASNMYGSNKRDAKRLRAGRHGLLKINTSPIAREQGLIMVPGGKNALGCVAPSPDMTCPDAGDLRINQHTGLVAIHSLLLREHNRIATFISKRRPELSDETVFQVTRKIMGAIMQHITYKEMIPLIVGPNIFNNPANGLRLEKSGFCDCYDEDIDAGITVEFGAAAFRFHTLLTDWLPVREPNGKFYPLYQHFSNAKMFYKPGVIDELLVNFPHDIPEKFDHEFGFIMQNQLFKPQDRPFGSDIMTLNLQRGKDTGTPTYAQMRSVCKLPPIRSFPELERVMAPEAARKLSTVYKSVQDIDLFAGGVSENPVNGNGLVGPTFACIITEQFKRLKHGDRFWYENQGIFTPDQLREIRKTSMAALLCINSPTEAVQRQALLRDSPANPIESCEEILSNQMRLEPFLANIASARPDSA